MTNRKLVLFASFTLLFLVIANFAFANEGEHAHVGAVEIPWRAIIVQAVNLGGLILFLGWILRKTISQHFADRRQIYFDLVQKADAAKDAAERSRSEVLARLKELQTSASQSVQQAKAEAAELRERIVREAKDLAEKLRAETSRTAQMELEKAKNNLRQEMLNIAVEASRKALQERVGGAEQKKLQSEFVEKIQAVQ